LADLLLLGQELCLVVGEAFFAVKERSCGFSQILFRLIVTTSVSVVELFLLDAPFLVLVRFEAVRLEFLHHLAIFAGDEQIDPRALDGDAALGHNAYLRGDRPI
jgi:hypothetical protein